MPRLTTGDIDELNDNEADWANRRDQDRRAAARNKKNGKGATTKKAAYLEYKGSDVSSALA